MKKILLVSLITVMGLTVSFAQNTGKFKTAASVDSAIVTNAGTSHLYIEMRQKAAESIQLNIVKSSGTLAGTVTFYGSNDGVNYVALTDATSTPTVTTYTVTDAGTYSAPQSTMRYLGFHSCKYYRITWVGSGTMAGYMKAFVNAKQ